MNYSTRITSFVLIFLFVWSVVCLADTSDGADPFSAVIPAKSEVRAEIREKAEEAEKMEDKREAAEEEKRIAAEKEREKQRAAAKSKLEEQIDKINLPDDRSQQFTIDNITISGNSLISTDELLENVPLVFNVSDKPLERAESSSLYDFRILYEIISAPGQPRQLSARTIQGFTRYILSEYQKKGYAGKIGRAHV